MFKIAPEKDGDTTSFNGYAELHRTFMLQRVPGTSFANSASVMTDGCECIAASSADNVEEEISRDPDESLGLPFCGDDCAKRRIYLSLIRISMLIFCKRDDICP
jgi:hypothetical protein